MAATAATAPKTKTPRTAKAPRESSASAAKASAAQAEARQATIAKRAAMLFDQVSEPTRLRVILMLAENPRNVTAISDVLSQSQPATSHHLALLRHGGLIEATRCGKTNVYSLTSKGQRLAAVVTSVTEGE